MIKHISVLAPLEPLSYSCGHHNHMLFHAADNLHPCIKNKMLLQAV